MTLSSPSTSLESKASLANALADVHAGRIQTNSGFSQIPVSILLDKIDFNQPDVPPIGFYVFKDGTASLIRQPGEGFSRLAISSYEHIWVRDVDFKFVRDYVDQLILNPKVNISLKPEERMDTLRRSAMIVVEDLFEHPSAENINRSTKVVGSFVYVLMKDPKAYLMLSKLSTHDPYTLQHSVGTSVNSIILARKVGVTDEKELLEAGLAGLLHDVGKVQVKKEIINKPGPLDPLEWEEMKTHSHAGFEIVKNNPQLSERTKRAILEHHEEKNGTGYPGGLREDGISLFSKIVCISDIFNALTTTRSYSQARSPFDAFQLMREKLMHKVDEKLFKQLVLIYGGKVDPS